MRRNVFFLLLMLFFALSFAVAEGSREAGSEGDLSDFPNREIRIIVPWGSGGSTDIMARKMQEILKVDFDINAVIINKAGGSSAVGLAEVMTSEPNGYTVGIASSTIISLMALKEVDFVPENFTNITMVSEDPLLLLVNKDSAWDNLESFMGYMSENPNKVTIGTPGAKNINHALAALTALSIDASFKHLNFEGGSRVITEIMGNHINAGVLKPSETITQIEAGELIPLGVYRQERLDVLPDVPTFKEKGINVFKYGNVAQISHIVAPAGISEDVRNALIEIFKKVISSQKFQDFANERGFLPTGISGVNLDTVVDGIYDGMAVVGNKAFID